MRNKHACPVSKRQGRAGEGGDSGDRATLESASLKDAGMWPSSVGAGSVIPRLAMNHDSSGSGVAGLLNSGNSVHRQDCWRAEQQEPMASCAHSKPISDTFLDIQPQRQYRIVARAGSRPQQAASQAMRAEPMSLMSEKLLTTEPGQMTGPLQPLSFADLIEWWWVPPRLLEQLKRNLALVGPSAAHTSSTCIHVLFTTL